MCAKRYIFLIVFTAIHTKPCFPFMKEVRSQLCSNKTMPILFTSKFIALIRG